LPFGALPVAQRRQPGGPNREASRLSGSRPLIADHEIVALPSVSVLAALRLARGPGRVAEKAVAVLADPVFEASDSRVAAAEARRKAPSVEQTSAVASAELQRSVRDFGSGGFRRLRSSRQEAEAIAALAPSGRVLKALDFAASRATAAGTALGDYRIIHFATHGLINTQHPELSGLVFSLVDENGKPLDGFLRLNEIYNMNLKAELVVLSACQSALGKDLRGEGLVGLARGFMYAGAPQVAASLWSVEDQATAELMKRFYRRLLGGGSKPAAALRAAQLEMLNERQWASPYHWAGFVIQGDWR
jgi:CHAT domain-containing protein